MARLLLVRHGDTKSNSRERLWGATDVELSDAGIEQAERLRDYLATEKIDAIYSSNLKRALVTAEIIASRHQLAITTCPELREVNFGELEGLTFEEVRQLYPELTRLWVERSADLRYPGGDSLDEFSQRITQFLNRLEQHNTEETVLIVAHSGVLRTILCQLLGMEQQGMRQFRLDLASLSILDTYPQGAILSRLNDISHLR